MSVSDPILMAVHEHRQAWDAFQVAPDGKEAGDAECAMRDAMDALMSAACAFPVLSAPLPDSAAALLAHLRWWLAVEVGQADSYQPDYAVLKGRAADLALALEPANAGESDLIELARMYGGVCGDLWVHRHLLEGILDEAGELR